MFPVMTNKEYREGKGVRCPVCRDHYINPVGSAYWGGEAVAQVDYVCRMCNSTWTEVHKLTGFINLQEGVETCR